ncbi:MAG: tRNA preQ1(34) S-adenosylmethionine ribosyltransferase-isomerase QueA [Bacillota bacterium]|jgi:S-adenosylmethionine:tRNA ribosyltransferase-isomerase
MKLEEFNYDLPERLIAQTPIEKRDESRLLVLHRDTGDLEHKHFYDLLEYLNPGDVLVLNDTRVLPARLYAHKETGAAVELVLINQVDMNHWKALVRPGRKALPGTKLLFESDRLTAEVEAVVEEGMRLIKFNFTGNFFEILDEIGNMPLPPYIKEKLEDKERYQPVYARENGSAAAPTAGLHFTPELLRKIEAKGVFIAKVLLHVGLGTFRPVKVENIEEHQMHAEYYQVTQETADLINNARKNGGRVIAVGTTSTRTLETVADENGAMKAESGWTRKFIYPGYKYKIVDVLVTNFHLPESTLLMLISAFACKEQVFKAYDEAIKEEYRFFSFGDAMLIL